MLLCFWLAPDSTQCSGEREIIKKLSSVVVSQMMGPICSPRALNDIDDAKQHDRATRTKQTHAHSHFPSGCTFCCTASVGVRKIGANLARRRRRSRAGRDQTRNERRVLSLLLLLLLSQ